MSSKISQLATGTAAQNADEIVIARGGSSFKLTIAQILTAGLAATFGALTAQGDVVVSRVSAGGLVVAQVYNSDNTNPASHARINATVGGASAGDPYVLWDVSGVTGWIAGIDNSDSDKWKLSAGLALGTNDCITVTTAGVVTIVNGGLSLNDFYVTRAIAGGNVVCKVENTDNTNALSHAFFYAIAGGASGGDAYVSWLVPSTTQWVAGLDNSDADKWKLSAGGTLGTNDCIVVAPGGQVNVQLGDFYVIRTAAGGNVISGAQNNDNTNAASHAFSYLVVAGASSGDPKVVWEIGGVLDWAAGVDNSDSDKWKLSASINLGTNDALVIDTSMNLTVPGGSWKSTHATAGFGYGTGAGGTVTQATSKSTGVTLNKATGQITMNGAALAAGTIVSFVLTNSAIAATDILLINHISAGTPGSYTVNARAAAGSATIDVRNNTAGSLSEAIVLAYAVIKAVTS